MIAASFNKWYPIELWLTSIAIGTLLFFIISLFGPPLSSIQPDALFGLVLMFTFGLLYSIPTAALCLIVHLILIKKLYPPIVIKTTLGIISMISVFLTILVNWGTEAFVWQADLSGLVIYLTYAISVVISSSFLKI